MAGEGRNAFKGTAENLSGSLVATRKKFSTNANLTDDDVILIKGHAMTVRDALKHGFIFRKSDGVTLGENNVPGVVTRVNS